MSTSPAETVAARISRILAERIVAGQLAPGTRLRQDHIAGEFGASHVPVREAFRQLNLNIWLDHATDPFVEMSIYDEGAHPVDLDHA